MKLFTRSILLLVLVATCVQKAAASDTTAQKNVKATILLPLYLDSAFKDGSYKYENSIPKFILSALEFYNGVQLAADSLEQEGIHMRIEVVDSRKQAATEHVFNTYNTNKPDIVIGVVQSGSELKHLSGLALNNNIPFISATYPNDGGVTNNQNLLIVNSTLKTHCFALYQYLQKNNLGNNIVLVTRKGGVDDRIKNYLKEAEKATGGYKFKWSMASLPDSFSKVQLAVYLDSNKKNTIIGASFDKDFSLRIVETLSSIKDSYNSSVFGMPTWDELPLQDPQYKGVDVYFSTPFVSYSGNADVFTSLSKKFKKIANSKPSDMVFKGFEITYRYLKTYYYHPADFMRYINDSSRKIFADFKFEPIQSKDTSATINYWENKKIYFVKKTDGAIKGVY